MKKGSFLVCVLALTLLYAPFLHAQRNADHDTTYFTSYPHHFALRLYLSQKYGTLYFRSERSEDVEYRINTKLHVGAGITVGNLSLNGGIGVAYLNSNGKDRGKTTSYDLQAHLYPYKWVMDGILIYDKGYHLNRPDIFPLNSKFYYYRPDVSLVFVGGAAYRIVNADKFSFRAAMGQSEWQKKSAGSFLYGANISYGRIKGDSALIPYQLQSSFQQAGISSINFFHAGPGVGYAYTLVPVPHFFIMASLIGNLNLNVTSEQKSSTKTNTVSVMPGAIYKSSIGYNSNTWSVAAELAGNALLTKGKLKDGGYLLPIGIYRFVVTRKFVKK